MSEFALTCSGPITVDTAGVPACLDGWVVTQIEVFDIGQIDPVQVAGFVGSGFFVLLPLWVAMYGGRALLNAIR